MVGYRNNVGRVPSSTTDFIRHSDGGVSEPLPGEVSKVH